jgi:phytoene dehydrogenase-like protein
LLPAITGRSFSLREKASLAIHAAFQILRSDEALLRRETGRTSMEELRRLGLDGAVLEKFLRPFFAGVFLDNDLGTDSSVLRYDLKKFSLGRALLPAKGMGEIPRQLASRLPAGRQRYDSPASSLEWKGNRVAAVILHQGERIPCDAVVLATDEEASRRLLGLPPGRSWCSTSTLYFTGAEPLYDGALIVLPEGRERIVRHFTDLTNIAPEYAPPGRRLLSATILNHPEGDAQAAARAEITAHFSAFEEWDFLKEVRIRRAIPSQTPGFHSLQPPLQPAANVLLAGDQVSTAGIDSALANGLRTADAVVGKLV